MVRLMAALATAHDVARRLAAATAAERAVVDLLQTLGEGGGFVSRLQRGVGGGAARAVDDVVRVLDVVGGLGCHFRGIGMGRFVG